MTSATEYPQRSFYHADPVARLLIERLRLSPLSLGLVTAAIVSGLYLLAAGLSNTLWSAPGHMGLLNDWLPWIWVLFVNPLVAGYYLWSLPGIASVIHDLEASDVVETNQAEIEQFSLQLYSQRWRWVFALAVGVANGLIFYSTRSGLDKSWTGAGTLPAIAGAIAALIIGYIGSMLILNLITNIWILHNVLASKEISVNPLHPDRCGGLRSLSDYSLKTAYLAAALGICVGLIEYQFITQGAGRTYWFVHLIIPLHIGISIACFFGPLWAAHTGMRRAKEELLNQIARQFQKDYSQIQNSLTGAADTLKKGTEKIQELRTFYKLTDEFPVWPFDVQTFRRFLLTVSAPIFTLLIALLQKLVTTQLKKWGIDLG